MMFSFSAKHHNTALREHNEEQAALAAEESSRLAASRRPTPENSTPPSAAPSMRAIVLPTPPPQPPSAAPSSADALRRASLTPVTAERRPKHRPTAASSSVLKERAAALRREAEQLEAQAKTVAAAEAVREQARGGKPSTSGRGGSGGEAPWETVAQVRRVRALRGGLGLASRHGSPRRPAHASSPSVLPGDVGHGAGQPPDWSGGAADQEQVQQARAPRPRPARRRPRSRRPPTRRPSRGASRGVSSKGLSRSTSRKAVPLPPPVDNEALYEEEEEAHAAIFGRKGELLEDSHAPQPSFSLSRHVGGSHTPLGGNQEHTLAGRKRLSGQHAPPPPGPAGHVPSRSRTHNSPRAQFVEVEYAEAAQEGGAAPPQPEEAAPPPPAASAPVRSYSRQSSLVPQPGGFHKGVFKP